MTTSKNEKPAPAWERKSLAAIKAACTRAGHRYNCTDYEKGGDWISISGYFPDRFGEGMGARILYNTVNATFIGKTATGERFDSNTMTHDAEPWFQAMLALLYKPKEKAPARSPQRLAAAVLLAVASFTMGKFAGY